MHTCIRLQESHTVKALGLGLHPSGMLRIRPGNRRFAGIMRQSECNLGVKALNRFSGILSVFEPAWVTGHRDLKTLMDHYYREPPEQIAQML